MRRNASRNWSNWACGSRSTISARASSLAYLRQLPLYEIKIDRSFINGLPGDTASVGIVCSILSMGSHLGLHVVAEGVETQEQSGFPAGQPLPVPAGLAVWPADAGGNVSGERAGPEDGGALAGGRPLPLMSTAPQPEHVKVVVAADQAARGCVFDAVAAALEMPSRSGLSVTDWTGAQLRVLPDQRAGLRCRAWV